MHQKMKNSDYLTNKLKLNTNEIDPNQHNEVDRMRITGDNNTLIFCVGVFKGRSLSFYLSTTALLHSNPPPIHPTHGSTQLNPNIFVISGVGSLVKVGGIYTTFRSRNDIL